MDEVDRLTGRLRMTEQALSQARARNRELEQDLHRAAHLFRTIQRALSGVPKLGKLEPTDE